MRFVLIALVIAVATGVLAGSAGHHGEAAWPGANGRIAYADITGDGIWIMDSDGSNRVQLTTGNDDNPRWSPDGTKIAFRRITPEIIEGVSPNLLEVWTMNADGSDPQFLTIGDEPAWHPSGESLVFTRDYREIWRIDVDGDSEAPVLADPDEVYTSPAYSPDSNYLAFNFTEGGVIFSTSADVQGGSASDIWVWNLDTLARTQITDTPAFNEGPADWHPTEERLVFAVHGLGIATADLDTAPAYNVIRPETDSAEPAYSPDGEKIVYATGFFTMLDTGISGFGSTVQVMNADGSDPQPLQDSAGGEVAPDWQPLEIETPTPTPTPSPSPTATPSPSPTPTPAGPTPVTRDLVWADNNCSDKADPVDALLTLRYDAGLSVNTGDCPPMGTPIEVLSINVSGLGEGDGDPQTWGDADCSTSIDPVDALKILRYDAALAYAQEEGCPPIGAEVTVQHAP